MYEHYATLRTDSVPDYINWLEEGAITPVVNHTHHCAAAWGHVARKTMEAAHYIKTGELLQLSS